MKEKFELGSFSLAVGGGLWQCLPVMQNVIVSQLLSGLVADFSLRESAEAAAAWFIQAGVHSIQDRLVDEVGPFFREAVVSADLRWSAAVCESPAILGCAIAQAWIDRVADVPLVAAALSGDESGVADLGVDALASRYGYENACRLCGR